MKRRQLARWQRHWRISFGTRSAAHLLTDTRALINRGRKKASWSSSSLHGCGPATSWRLPHQRYRVAMLPARAGHFTTPTAESMRHRTGSPMEPQEYKIERRLAAIFAADVA